MEEELWGIEEGVWGMEGEVWVWAEFHNMGFWDSMQVKSSLAKYSTSRCKSITGILDMSSQVLSSIVMNTFF